MHACWVGSHVALGKPQIIAEAQKLIAVVTIIHGSHIEGHCAAFVFLGPFLYANVWSWASRRIIEVLLVLRRLHRLILPQDKSWVSRKSSAAILNMTSSIKKRSQVVKWTWNFLTSFSIVSAVCAYPRSLPSQNTSTVKSSPFQTASTVKSSPIRTASTVRYSPFLDSQAQSKIQDYKGRVALPGV
jgi:hypothetical protein